MAKLFSMIFRMSQRDLDNLNLIYETMKRYSSRPEDITKSDAARYAITLLGSSIRRQKEEDEYITNHEPRW